MGISSSKSTLTPVQLVTEGLAKIQARQAAAASSTADEKAEIAILLEVYQAMNHALSKA